jgi:hypothetical protein
VFQVARKNAIIFIPGNFSLNRPSVRASLASVAIVAAATVLAGCNSDSIIPTGRAQAPLSEKMLAEISAKNMDKEATILDRIFKEESEMEIWKQNRDGQFALLKTYPICLLVRRSRSQEKARRSSGARGLLHYYAGADESELQVLPCVQYRLSEQL